MPPDPAPASGATLPLPPPASRMASDATAPVEAAAVTSLSDVVLHPLPAPIVMADTSSEVSQRQRSAIENAPKALRLWNNATVSIAFDPELKDLMRDFASGEFSTAVSDEKRAAIFTKARAALVDDVGFNEYGLATNNGRLARYKERIVRYVNRNMTYPDGRNPETEIYMRCVVYNFISYLSHCEHWSAKAIEFKDAQVAEFNALTFWQRLGRNLGMSASPVRPEQFFTGQPPTLLFDFSTSQTNGPLLNLVKDGAGRMMHLSGEMPASYTPATEEEKARFVENKVREFVLNRRSRSISRSGGSAASLEISGPSPSPATPAGVPVADTGCFGRPVGR